MACPRVTIIRLARIANFHANRLLRGAGGAEADIRASARIRCPGELEGQTPSRPPRPRESGSRLIRIRMRPSRALLVGLRPPTPQSPERLRSTPFDCVASASCCFAERKAVLSHALAMLTALGPVRGQSRRDMLRGALRA